MKWIEFKDQLPEEGTEVLVWSYGFHLFEVTGFVLDCLRGDA